MLERHYNAKANTGEIVIRMRALRSDEAKLLGLAPHHRVIELNQVMRDADETPFCFDRQVWRGEMAEFSATAVVSG